MTHTENNDRLSAFIDGDLDPPAVAELERELSDDPVLRQQYEELLAAVEFVREHGPTDAPLGFATRVIAHADDIPMASAWWQRLLAPFKAIPIEGLAVAMAALLVVYVIGKDPAPTPADPPSETVAVAPSPAVASPTAPAVTSPEAQPPAPAAQPAEAVANNVFEAQPAQPNGEREQLLGELIGGQDGRDPLDGAVAAMPEAGEQPEGEATGSVSGALNAQLNARVAYKLQSDSGQALHDLRRLASQNNGQLLDAATGQPLTPYRLGDADEGGASGPVRVLVSVPASNLAAFTRDLSAMGQLTRTSGQTDALTKTGERLQVYVELNYQAQAL